MQCYAKDSGGIKEGPCQFGICISVAHFFMQLMHLSRTPALPHFLLNPLIICMTNFRNFNLFIYKVILIVHCTKIIVRIN